jgi:hypothetical protein
MTLDLAPGTTVTLDGQSYSVEESASFHEVDFRLDLVCLAGPSPAHERWLLAVQTEPHLMLLQRLEQDWLTPLRSGFVHERELFTPVTRGAAHRVRRARGGNRTKGRLDYALFRSNTGRVMLTIGENEEVDAWIGVTLPPGAVGLPGHAA